MPTWELIGHGTDQRYAPDIRYRAYTKSEICAKAFGRIPKIQFTDSGHGIVFSARPHSGKRKPVVTVVEDHVDEHLHPLMIDVRQERRTKAALDRIKEIDATRTSDEPTALTDEEIQEERDMLSRALFQPDIVDAMGFLNLRKRARLLATIDAKDKEIARLSGLDSRRYCPEHGEMTFHENYDQKCYYCGLPTLPLEHIWTETISKLRSLINEVEIDLKDARSCNDNRLAAVERIEDFRKSQE